MATFISSTSANGGSGASSLNLTAAAHQTGNTIVGVVKWEDATKTITVTDTAGNTYTVLTIRNNSNQPFGCIFYSINITGHASNIINVAFNSYASICNAFACEYQPAGTIAFDSETYKTGSGTSWSTTISLSGAGFICTGLCEYQTGTWTAGTVFTLRGSVGSQGTGFMDKLAAAAGSNTVAATHSTSQSGLLVIAAFTDASGGSTINLTGNISGASVTGDLAAVLARALASAPAGVSATPDLSAATARALLAAISGQSATPDLSATISNMVALVASISGSAMTPDLAASIARDLSAAVGGQSTAPDLSAAIARSLSAGIVGIGAAPDLPASMQRLLSASIQGAGATPDISASTIRALGVSIAATNAAPDLSAVITRSLLAAISGQSVVPDLSVIVEGMVSLTASISGASSTPDISATSSRQLSAGISGQGAAPDLSAAVARSLLATIAATSGAPDLEGVLTNVVALTAAVQGVAITADLSATIARDLSAHVMGLADAPGMYAAVQRSLAANVSAVSFAPNNLTVLLGEISPLNTFASIPIQRGFTSIAINFSYRSFTS